MTAAFLGGVTSESIAWWALYAAPAALLVVLVLGLPVAAIALALLLLARPPRHAPR